MATAVDYDALVALALRVTDRFPSPGTQGANSSPFAVPELSEQESQFVRQDGLGGDAARLRCKVNPPRYVEDYYDRGKSRDVRGLELTIEQGRKGGDTAPSDERHGEAVTLHMFLLPKGEATAVQTMFSCHKGTIGMRMPSDIDGAKELLRQVTMLIGNPDTLVTAPTAKEQKQPKGSRLGRFAVKTRT